MPIQEVEEIFTKYRNEENRLETIFRNKQEEIGCKENSLDTLDDSRKYLNPDLAKQRNEALLKELEVVKGNLRAKSIFSPAEMQWEQICERYQAEPSLPITSWRCHLSVFV